MAALSAAILVDHPPDLRAAEAALEHEGLRVCDMPSTWRHPRIRRQIMDGNTTQAAVFKVMQDFKDRVCPMTGSSVVTEEVQEVYDNQAGRNITVKGQQRSVFDLMEGKYTSCTSRQYNKYQ